MLGAAHRAGYQEMIAEYVRVEGGYPFNDGAFALADFAAFLRDLDDERTGRDLPDGVSRQLTYIVVLDDGEVAGEFRLRPWLEPPYRSDHGHTGYNVRPSARHRGVATAALRELRRIAGAQYGLPVLTMDIEGSNPFSLKTIEANEGREVEQDIASDVRWYECPTLR